MPYEPYRFRDKRYYTPETDTSATPEAPVTDVSASEPQSAPDNNTPKSLKKPMLWSLAAAGGIAALSMLWVSRYHKKEQALTV